MAAPQTLTLLVVVRIHYPQPYGALVKRLRHRPFTAVTRVRFSYASPYKTNKFIKNGDLKHGQH